MKERGVVEDSIDYREILNKSLRVFFKDALRVALKSPWQAYFFCFGNRLKLNSYLVTFYPFLLTGLASCLPFQVKEKLFWLEKQEFLSVKFLKFLSSKFLYLLQSLSFRRIKDGSIIICHQVTCPH